jgi:hypothetical protein
MNVISLLESALRWDLVHARNRMVIETPCALFDGEMEVLPGNAPFDGIGTILWVRHVSLSHLTGKTVRVVGALTAEVKEESRKYH